MRRLVALAIATPVLWDVFRAGSVEGDAGSLPVTGWLDVYAGGMIFVHVSIGINVFTGNDSKPPPVAPVLVVVPRLFGVFSIIAVALDMSPGTIVVLGKTEPLRLDKFLSTLPVNDDVLTVGRSRLEASTTAVVVFQPWNVLGLLVEFWTRREGACMGKDVVLMANVVIVACACCDLERSHDWRKADGLSPCKRAISDDAIGLTTEGIPILRGVSGGGVLFEIRALTVMETAGEVGLWGRADVPVLGTSTGRIVLDIVYVMFGSRESCAECALRESDTKVELEFERPVGLIVAMLDVSIETPWILPVGIYGTSRSSV
jgi:hypothetical protein